VNYNQIPATSYKTQYLHRRVTNFNPQFFQYGKFDFKTPLFSIQSKKLTLKHCAIFPQKNSKDHAIFPPKTQT
jgi:hypothetical protein